MPIRQEPSFDPLASQIAAKMFKMLEWEREKGISGTAVLHADTVKHDYIHLLYSELTSFSFPVLV